MYITLGGALIVAALIFLLIYCLCRSRQRLSERRDDRRSANATNGTQNNDRENDNWSNYATFNLGEPPPPPPPPPPGGGTGIFAISDAGDMTLPPKYEELFPEEEGNKTAEGDVANADPTSNTVVPRRQSGGSEAPTLSVLETVTVQGVPATLAVTATPEASTSETSTMPEDQR
jgi:hypothetical protein